MHFSIERCPLKVRQALPEGLQTLLNLMNEVPLGQGFDAKLRQYLKAEKFGLDPETGANYGIAPAGQVQGSAKIFCMARAIRVAHGDTEHSTDAAL